MVGSTISIRLGWAAMWRNEMGTAELKQCLYKRPKQVWVVSNCIVWWQKNDLTGRKG